MCFRRAGHLRQLSHAVVQGLTQAVPTARAVLACLRGGAAVDAYRAARHQRRPGKTARSA